MSRRIAHIVQRMAPGGLEVIALELSRQLPGNHVIISLDGTPDSLTSAWPRLNSIRGALHALDKAPGFDVGLFGRIRGLLTSLQIDSVVTHHAGPFIYGGVAARLAGVDRMIHVEHDVWHYQSAKRRALMKLVARIARPTVVGVAEQLRPTLEDIFGERCVSIIPNGVVVDGKVANRSAIRRRLGVAETARVIGAAGRLETVKGHDVLLDAMARLPSDTILILAGDGSRRDQLVSRARVLGISERVMFLGHRDDVADLYSAFDVFCQPSRNEGLPLAVLESQAAGTPVVATSVGDLAAAVCPRSGLLVPSESPAALARGLLALLEKRGGDSPREFISSRYNWRDTLGGYAGLLGV